MNTTTTLSRADRVQALVAEQMNRPRDEVQPDKRLIEDLGGDSLDHVELCMATEDEFHLEIADEDWEKVKTVSDITALVDTYLNVLSRGVR